MSVDTNEMRIPVFTYGDRIRRVRLDQGLNQDEFAREVGVEGSLIGRHEKLDGPPTRNRKVLALLIQMRFGVPADWIIGGQVTDGKLASSRRHLALVA